MITFTFVNKWNEVSDTEKEIGKILGQKLDIRFCALEEMEIWKKRFLAIKKNGFQDLLSGMNLGVPIHYTWRLEFQARGAPHVHSLIWLEEPLDITKINKTFFAQMPNKDPSHNQKINLNAKFFIRNGNSHISNQNNFNEIDEIMHQRNDKSYYLASDHEIKIFCGAMKKISC